MTAKGVVIELNGDMARVRCKRESACASCHNCEASGACHAELIFGEASGEVVVEAVNSVNAQTGDTVEISSSTANTLLYSVLIFLFPCLAAYLSYMGAEGLGLETGICALFLVCGFAISFFVTTKLLNGFIRTKKTLEITNILGEIDV